MGFRHFYIKTVVSDILFMPATTVSFCYFFVSGREKINSVPTPSVLDVYKRQIMERLGGGGHINTAGAQFPYSDMERAIETLKKTIDIMIEEGDI